jgi:hypothetical protein
VLQSGIFLGVSPLSFGFLEARRGKGPGDLSIVDGLPELAVLDGATSAPL